MPGENGPPYVDLLELSSQGDGWFEAEAEPFGLKAGAQLLLTAACLAAFALAVAREFLFAFLAAALAAFGAWRLNRKLPGVFVKFERGAGGIAFRWGEKNLFKRLDTVILEVRKVKIPNASSYLAIRLHGEVFGRPAVQLMLDTKDLDMAHALAEFMQGYVRNDQVPGGAPSSPIKAQAPMSAREYRRAFAVLGIVLALVFLLIGFLSRMG